jgi:nicotinate-nucleotide pyrophosphorylase (carboxylating)
MFVPRKILEEKLLSYLAEDVGQGDVTSEAVIPEDLDAEADVLAKADGILAGVEEAKILAESIGLNVGCFLNDGEEVSSGNRIMSLSGKARTILAVERTLLNLVSRMSAIATQTNKLKSALKKANSTTKITATRKTAPGLNYFDKKAVIIGGGDPHRLHLDDLILIKDNHIVLTGGIEEALSRIKKNASFSKKIEIEVTTEKDAYRSAELGADIVMLDNFSPKQVKEVAKKIKSEHPKIIIEVSGGITEDNLREYASESVDLISLGALTHSVKAFDVSLEMIST